MTPHQRRAIKLPGFGGASPYKGVSTNNSLTRPWRAQIIENYKQIYIGSYPTQVEAAKAYDRKAKSLWGFHCYLNFPPGST